MTKPPLPTQIPDHPRPDPPMAEALPQGFLDCRGEWQALDDEDGDGDAGS